MGKTAGGAIWLNKEKLSEYDYWQFWRNTSDEDTIKFLKLFTELSLEEIAELEQLKGSEINNAKIVLADEATAMLHGRECLTQIHETVQNMFKGAGESTDGLPRISVSADDLDGDGKRFADLFELFFAFVLLSCLIAIRVPLECCLFVRVSNLANIYWTDQRQTQQRPVLGHR